MTEDRTFNACEWLLDRHVREGRGDRVAIRSGGASYTYAEILDRVRATAAGLRSLGVRPEERVLLVLLDSVEFVVSFLGAIRIGAIPVPANPQSRPADLARIAEDARVRLAVVSGARAALVPALKGLSGLVVTGREEPPGPPGVVVHRWADVMSTPGDVTPYAAGGDFPGFWLCTGGTTGHPKLVMHRHVDLRLTAENYSGPVLALTGSDRCYSVGPMFHAYGLGNSLTFPFAVGATSVLEPTRPLTPALVADLVAREKPTLFFCIPTFYAALLSSDIPDQTFASVRLGVSAAEPLPAGIWRRFKERFGVEILDGIGSTEALHMFISNLPQDIVPGSSGRVVPGWEARILDEQGQPVPLGEAGHLFVRGDSMATGYWCQADWSRRTFRGEWASTGDIYACSPDGHYTYLGRSDDMLRVSGEWVSPAEVEAVLIEHADVEEAAVVGAQDPNGLQKPVAFVIGRMGSGLSPEDVIDFCRARLPSFKCPRRVVITEELPKTVTGKIQRFRLREKAVGLLS